MKTRRCCLVLIITILVSLLSSAQILNEQLFPVLPYKGVSASIAYSPNGFYINGNSAESWYSPFDYWGDVSQQFFLLSPDQLSNNAVLLPDLESSWSHGFGGYANFIHSAPVITNSDSLFVLWSNIRVEFTDVPPSPIFDTSCIVLARLENDTLKRILYFPGGLNPSMVSDQNQSLHFVWENVSQIDTAWGGRTSFSVYSSKLYYQARDISGEFSTPIALGKGFLPDIKIKNDNIHLFYLAGDSSNQSELEISYSKGDGINFSDPVYLKKIFVNPHDYFGILNHPSGYNFRWSVDENENIHIVWGEHFPANKTFVLHYSTTEGKQIDSIDDVNAQVSFSDNGDVRIFNAVSSGDGESVEFMSYVSRLGETLDTVSAVSLHLNLSLNQMLVDTGGYEHALLAGNGKTYFLRNAVSDSAKLVFLSSKYSINPSSYVDRDNKAWLTGKRDSTAVVLNFNIDDVRQNFVFPLEVGNEWHYLTYAEPPGMEWPIGNIVKATRDTLMTNGKTYTELSSKMWGSVYWRKEGMKVFQYHPEDTSEFARFDFSKAEHDTVAVKLIDGEPRSIIIDSIFFKDWLGSELLLYRFSGRITDERFANAGVDVSDSIGVSHFGLMGPESFLVGVVIDGKEHGTILSVDKFDSGIPLSYSLSQNYPNPFNPSTTLKYQLPKRAHVTIKIFDVIGREVAVLVNEEKDAGTFKAIWNASQFSSGMYFARMTSGSFSSTKKLLLIK